MTNTPLVPEVTLDRMRQTCGTGNAKAWVMGGPSLVPEERLQQIGATVRDCA